MIDDGSTDRTPEIVRKFEPHVRLLQKANGGQASAFNAGIPECIGEVVAFLDGDDWWVPQKLSHVIPVFAKDPRIGMVGHGTIMMLSDGKQFTEVLRERTSVLAPDCGWRANVPVAKEFSGNAFHDSHQHFEESVAGARDDSNRGGRVRIHDGGGTRRSGDFAGSAFFLPVAQRQFVFTARV